MNILQKQLAQVCLQHKIREKLLICTNRSAGYQLLEGLAHHNISWLNLRPITPYELACQTAQSQLHVRQPTIPTEGQLHFLLEDILQEMAVAGSLHYFAELQAQGNLTRVLYPTLHELRLTGLLAKDLLPAAFVDAQKGRELQTILTRYEEKLAANLWADPATIYQLALTAPPSTALILIPAGLDVSPLATAFLQSFAKDCLILPQDPVENYPIQQAAFTTADVTAESPLSYLFQPEAAPTAPELTLFPAYGAANEARAILRHLHRQKIPLDQALICTPNRAAYLPLFYTVTQRLDLPTTFADGIPLTFTHPGSFVLQLVRWIAENYASKVLYRLLNSSDIKLPQARQLARLLREAKIGWDRQRYQSCVAQLLTIYELRAQAAVREDNETLAAYLEQKKEQVSALQSLVSELLTQLPESSAAGTIKFPDLCQALINLTATYARVAHETDGQALAAITESLTEAAAAYPLPILLKEGLMRLEQVLAALQVGASAPQPGHLHITSLTQAEHTYRPYTFVCGLADVYFPGSGLQDPVLLDQERQQLHPQLALKAQEPAKQQWRLARFLAARRGAITLSYPSTETVEGRTLAPAAILLQAYRLAAQQPQATYHQLVQALGQPAGYEAEGRQNALTLDEWWLTAALHNDYQHDAAVVAACFPGLAQGLLAEESRSSDKFTDYDGKVEPDASLDLRASARVLSATQFERLATCPFSYFLRYVLRIEPPEETEFAAGSWLDPLTRGSLLHDIYCSYLRELHSAGDTVKHRKQQLLAIADELIKQAKAQVPPPSELIFEYEREEMLQGLEIFLRSEEANGATPAYLEVPFGCGAEDVQKAGFGLAEPVKLALPDGSAILIRGRIDRIDYGETAHQYQIWDYKTDSTYGFETGQMFKQGRRIQHALYAYAAETIFRQTKLDQQAAVVSSGYLFPTEKGEGQRFTYTAADRGKFLELLLHGLTLAAQGSFCSTEDKERCTFCEYAYICRQEQATARAKLKKLDPQLINWRELQQYE